MQVTTRSSKLSFPTSSEEDDASSLRFSSEPLAFSTDEDLISNDLHDSVLDVRHPDSPYGLIQEVLPAKKTPPRVR